MHIEIFRILLLGQLLGTRGSTLARHARNRKGHNREFPLDGQDLRFHTQRWSGLLSDEKSAASAYTHGKLETITFL